MYQSSPALFTPDTPVPQADLGEAERAAREGTLHLEGLRCHACAQRAEEALRRLHGVKAAKIGLLRDRASVHYDARRTSEEELAAAMRGAGYQVGTAPRPTRRWSGVRFGISAVAFVNLLAIARISGEDAGRSVGLVRLGLSALVLLVSGLPLWRRAFQLRKGRELLACGGALAAFGLGLTELATAKPALILLSGLADAPRGGPAFGFESAAAIVLMSCFAQLAAAALRRAARAHITARAEERATSARRLREGGAPELVPSEALAAGDRVLLTEGEQAPSDLALDGPACVAPRRARGILASSQKKAGEVIRAGEVLLSPEVTGRVIRGPSDLSRVLDEAVHRALARLDESPARAQPGSWCALAQDTVLISAQGFALFALVLHSWIDGYLLSPSALLAMIAVLVSASTAAFSLAAPTARAIAILRARALGVVIKDVSALERLAEADVACLDRPLAVSEGGPPFGGAGLGFGAKAAVRALWNRRVVCRLLSSAPREPTAETASWLGIVGSAGLSPEAKARAITALCRRGARVLLISGADPRAAGAEAADVTVAIAPGASPAAVSAPIVVSRDELDRVPKLIDLARALRRRLDENAALSMVYNALVIPAAALGWLSPIQAASLLLIEAMLGLSNASRLLNSPVADGLPEREAQATQPALPLQEAPEVLPATVEGNVELRWPRGASVVSSG